MSHSVQASTTDLKFFGSTPSSSCVGDSSTRSNRRGNESHKLKQRRHVWQMSKTRCSSFSTASGSVNAGSCHAIGWRVGASRLPSLMRIVLPCYARPLPVTRKGSDDTYGPMSGGQFVQSLLKTAGVRAFGFRQRLEPVGDFIEAFLASGAG